MPRIEGTGTKTPVGTESKTDPGSSGDEINWRCSVTFFSLILSRKNGITLEVSQAVKKQTFKDFSPFVLNI